jgi:hypothetical protein
MGIDESSTTAAGAYQPLYSDVSVSKVFAEAGVEGRGSVEGPRMASGSATAPARGYLWISKEWHNPLSADDGRLRTRNRQSGPRAAGAGSCGVRPSFARRSVDEAAQGFISDQGDSRVLCKPRRTGTVYFAASRSASSTDFEAFFATDRILFIDRRMAALLQALGLVP